MTTSRREVVTGSLALAVRVALHAGRIGVAASLTSCGGGGGGGVAAPAGLSYARPAQIRVGTPIPAMSPTVNGGVTSYSVSPTLPPGLSLDPTSGSISGTPTAAAPQTTYTITASNSGGSTTFALTLTVLATLTIASVSNAAPTALTPVSLTTTGLDVTSAFTVSLSNTSGYSATLNPIRTDSNGTVVIAAPLYIDPSSGNTAPLNASVQITQGAVSNAVALAIADIPSTASYGVSPGEISKAFFAAQTIHMGVTINALQAMRALPSSKADTTLVQQHLRQQQMGVIEASDNVDVIISGSQSSLAVGTATDGTAITFNANSVDIMDRTFAMYLQSIGYLPSTIYSAAASVRRVKNASRLSTKLVRAQALTPKQIIDGMGTFGGALGMGTAAVQTYKNTTANEWDFTLALGQGVTSAALVLGTVAAAPELVAAATIVGTGFAVAALATDAYKWYAASNAVDAAQNANNPAALAAAQAALTNAKESVGVDTVGLLLGPLGFPNEVASEAGIGAQVVKALTTAQTGLSGEVVQGLGLIQGAASLWVAATAPTEAATDGDTMTASNAEVPSGATSFGLADGSVTISNTNNPTLSPLPQMNLTEPNTQTTFTTVADTGGSYSLVVPLNVPGFNYSQMSIVPYDPVSAVDLSVPTIVDLTGLNTNAPVSLPPETGVCTDTDASAPDQDDPDCD
jgi:Putative Ig domain